MYLNCQFFLILGDEPEASARRRCLALTEVILAVIIVNSEGKKADLSITSQTTK
jgi:hypothetical protein